MMFNAQGYPNSQRHLVSFDVPEDVVESWTPQFIRQINPYTTHNPRPHQLDDDELAHFQEIHQLQQDVEQELRDLIQVRNNISRLQDNPVGNRVYMTLSTRLHQLTFFNRTLNDWIEDTVEFTRPDMEDISDSEAESQ